MRRGRAIVGTENDTLDPARQSPFVIFLGLTLSRRGRAIVGTENDTLDPARQSPFVIFLGLTLSLSMTLSLSLS
jgi:hypothetical protein